MFRVLMRYVLFVHTVLFINQELQAQSLVAPRLINEIAVPRDFPYLNITVNNNPAPGKVFITNDFGESYLMILDNNGTPYYYEKLDHISRNFKYHPSFDFITRNYPSSGFESNSRIQEENYGYYITIDNHFIARDTLRPHNNFFIDSHDVSVTPDSTFLLLVTENRIIDMSQIVEGGQVDAVVRGNHIQEVDFSGNLLFEWQCWDYFNLLDCIDPLTGPNVDFTHTNSLTLDYDGHILISSRHLNECTKINRQTGEIIWRLGGKKNQFDFQNEELTFSYQHDFEMIPGKPGNYKLFDNGNLRGDSSRVVEYALDTVNMVATKVWEYMPSARFSPSKGNAQRLSNGNTFIDWVYGPEPEITEVDTEGNIKYEIDLDFSTYRAFKYEFDGVKQSPELIVEQFHAFTRLIFNKFGDKNVDYYKIYFDESSIPETLYASTQDTYFDIVGISDNSTYYVKVTAVDFNNIESAASKIVPIVFGNDQNYSYAQLGQTPNKEESDPGWVLSDLGYALQFDGKDDIVYCGIEQKFKITDKESITIEALVKANSWKDVNEMSYIISNQESESGYFIAIGSKGNVQFGLGDGAKVYTVSSEQNVIDLNTWHHIAGVYSNSHMRIYVDGEEVADIFENFSIISTDQALTIGASAEIPNSTMDGAIDEIRLWSVARSRDEINNYRNIVLSCLSENLIGYWRFNENFGQYSIDLSNQNSQIHDNWELFLSSEAESNWISVNDQIEVDIIKGGNYLCEIQLMHDDVELIKGFEYVLSFEAEVTEDKIMEAKVIKSSSPFTNYGKIGAFIVNPEKRHYSFEFTMVETTVLNASIAFCIGGNNKDIKFSNINIYSIDSNMPVCEEDPNIVLGIDKNENTESLVLAYPNPVKDEVTITHNLLGETCINYTLIDLTGRVLISDSKILKSTDPTQLSLDIASVAYGHYILIIQVTSKTHEIMKSFKLIK